MQVILHWLTSNWGMVALVGFSAAVWLLIYLLLATGYFPRDANGNGIAIGRAKAFDNRSLALRIERLNAALETLKPVTPKATENSSEVQGQTVSETQLSLTASLQPGGEGKEKQSEGGKSGEQAGAGDKSGDKKEGDDKLGMAAGDVLTDQLNLASQIFNLQTLYERSLSDRIISEQNASNPRMQAVLGFQVSITPPAGAKDCVAVVEIAVRPRNGIATEPVSLVAMMPQEKTYNSTSLSTSEQSIGGSAVAKILNFNFGGKNRARQYFLHRDSDTVAFEHNPQAQPAMFEDDDPARSTVFGWEFRPVLGRRVVSPGTRQMLAVVSLPMGEHVDAQEDLQLEVKCRSYWRRYNRKEQTTRPKASWLPWRSDDSGTVDFPTQELAIPNIFKVQGALAPEIKTIKWFSTGQDTAAVTVTGKNFFSGTQVVIGGKVYRENDETNKLTLKSEQALEFHTTIESLTAGGAVLSGRFGPLARLEMPKGEVKTLDIGNMSLKRLEKSDIYRFSVDVVGLDDDANDKPYTVEYINKFPEPILLIGKEVMALPYDYYDMPEKATGSGTSSASPPPAANQAGAPGAGAPAGAAAAVAPAAAVPGPATAPGPTSGPTLLPSSSKNYVQVQVFVPGKLLAKNPSVSFRVPFCGMEYQVSKPITFADPTIVRLGEDAAQTVFRISLAAAGQDGSTVGSQSPISVDLDQNYSNPPQLLKVAEGEYLLKVPTITVAKFQKLVVRVGTLESHVLPIPPMEKPVAKPSIDTSSPPPETAPNAFGSVEWSGVSLEGITQVKLDNSPVDFAVYANGTKMRVYLTAAQIPAAGKKTIKCTTSSGEELSVLLFVK